MAKAKTRATSSALISPSAKIGENTTVGAFCVIEDGVDIGTECQIAPHVVIHEDSRIGDRVRVDAQTVIGKRPMRAKRSILKAGNDLPPTEIGEDCLIGAQAVIYRSARLAQHVLVADLATVREKVSIGEYTIVGRNVAIENEVTVGRKCKLETNCYITAYSTIEDFCFIAPMVTTSNDNFVGRTEERLKWFKGVTVRRGGRVGAGATILPGVTVGADALVGAGSVVTHDVPPHTIVVGVPARWFGVVPKEQRLEEQGWE